MELRKLPDCHLPGRRK